MLIAIFADIHANKQAFEACLKQARTDGAARFVLLGDIVGYGADPVWAVETTMDLAGRGAPAVRGNHDNAIIHDEDMNPVAQVAIDWTRGQLGRPQRDFLDALPMTQTEGERLYVHAEASRPERWNYVQNAGDAARSLVATMARVTFCGHIHRPALYTMSATGKMAAVTPTAGLAMPLLPGRQWLAVLGSVGQPRDGNPAASYAMLDTGRNELTYCRAPYDVEAAAERIRRSGLPGSLADRLLLGA